MAIWYLRGWGVRLLFLLNVLGAMFIPGSMYNLFWNLEFTYIYKLVNYFRKNDEYMENMVLQTFNCVCTASKKT